MSKVVLVAAVCGLGITASARAYDPEPVEHLTGGRVLVVGDSHTWMAGAGQQYPRWDTNCRIGRDSTEGVEVLRQLIRPRYGAVVFDLATNDAGDPAAVPNNLHAVRQLVGHRDLILVTSYRLDIGWAGARIADSWIHRFAHRHPQHVSVVEWGAYAAAHPAIFASDKLHFTSEGYLKRTKMIVRQTKHVTRSLRPTPPTAQAPAAARSGQAQPQG